jgi:hypothetical protein
LWTSPMAGIFWNMQQITLCLTSLTRFVAVVKPFHYKKLMTPRRIIAYCLCCYFVMIPSQPQVWMLFFGEPVALIIVNGYFIISVFLPLLLSLILNIITIRALNVHLKGISSSATVNEARDSRTIVIANLIEIFVPMLTIFPYALWMSIESFFVTISSYATVTNIYKDFPALGVVLRYFSYYKTYSPVTQGLITLFVIAPYRRLLLRPFRKNVVSPAPILVGTAPG